VSPAPEVEALVRDTGLDEGVARLVIPGPTAVDHEVEPALENVGDGRIRVPVPAGPGAGREGDPQHGALCVGQDWQGDVRVVLFVRLREGLSLDEPLRERIRRRIRENASPRHVPAKIIQVADIPRTLSGKITELAVRDVIHGRSVKNTEAIANPQALGFYKDLPELRT
jgi:acyl-CoA synthetase (AMP-forming)/AMP-acid ligase II